MTDNNIQEEINQYEEESLWRVAHRMKYLITLIIIIILILSYFIYDIFFSTVSCTDNRKNGDEIGIDCGGSCALLCKGQFQDLIIDNKNIRLEKVSDNKYNVYLLISNNNKDTAVYNIDVLTSFYDKDNNLIGTTNNNIPFSDNLLIPVLIEGITVDNLDRIESAVVNDYKIYKSPQNINLLKLITFNKEESQDKYKYTIKYTNPNYDSVINKYIYFLFYNNQNNLLYINKQTINLLAKDQIAQNIVYIPAEITDVNSIRLLIDNK